VGNNLRILGQFELREDLILHDFFQFMLLFFDICGPFFAWKAVILVIRDVRDLNEEKQRLYRELTIRNHLKRLSRHWGRVGPITRT